MCYRGFPLYNSCMLSQTEITQLSDRFKSSTPQEILSWAIETFWPQIVMSCSFQTQSMPLLHMATRIRRDLLIFFLDTGYHFWDTLIFLEQIASEWKLNVLDLYRDTRWNHYVRQHSRTLPLEDPDLCCYLNKVQPMQKALGDMKAWISGFAETRPPSGHTPGSWNSIQTACSRSTPCSTGQKPTWRTISRNTTCRRIRCW